MQRQWKGGGGQAAARGARGTRSLGKGLGSCGQRGLKRDGSGLANKVNACSVKVTRSPPGLHESGRRTGVGLAGGCTGTRSRHARADDQRPRPPAPLPCPPLEPCRSRGEGRRRGHRGRGGGRGASGGRGAKGGPQGTGARAGNGTRASRPSPSQASQNLYWASLTGGGSSSWVGYESADVQRGGHPASVTVSNCGAANGVGERSVASGGISHGTRVMKHGRPSRLGWRSQQ